MALREAWDRVPEEFRGPESRPIVPWLETCLGVPFGVLDHGFVRVVDYMGTDSAIVQAARVSYGKGTKATREDKALIRFLWENDHATPFEMCEIKLHVKLPIFVARQWIRHRTASVNEISARYSILEKEFYIPQDEALCVQAKLNRQGRAEPVPSDQAMSMTIDLTNTSVDAYSMYELLLNDDGDGKPIDPDKPMLARELARMVLPPNYYTSWYWKVNLRNLLNFLRLRMDEHAQWEIRQYADVIGEMVKEWVPHAWKAFEACTLNAVRFPEDEAKAMREYILALEGTMAFDLGRIMDVHNIKGERRRQAFLKKLGKS